MKAVPCLTTAKGLVLQETSGRAKSTCLRRSGLTWYLKYWWRHWTAQTTELCCCIVKLMELSALKWECHINILLKRLLITLCMNETGQLWWKRYWPVLSTALWPQAAEEHKRSHLRLCQPQLSAHWSECMSPAQGPSRSPRPILLLMQVLGPSDRMSTDLSMLAPPAHCDSGLLSKGSGERLVTVVKVETCCGPL